tara:strand:- start:323 stop:682 length:360 start_codon:yes stop_codon:yes gene_type:complete
LNPIVEKALLSGQPNALAIYIDASTFEYYRSTLLRVTWQKTAIPFYTCEILRQLVVEYPVTVLTPTVKPPIDQCYFRGITLQSFLLDKGSTGISNPRAIRRTFNAFYFVNIYPNLPELP